MHQFLNQKNLINLRLKEFFRKLFQIFKGTIVIVCLVFFIVCIVCVIDALSLAETTKDYTSIISTLSSFIISALSIFKMIKILVNYEHET